VSIVDALTQSIRERGPMTVAAFMEAALYHPTHGYYARAAQRSGRAGDFFTSVDVGPLFGDLVALQVAEMARLLPGASAPFDLIEAGAGNGRLSHDVLVALERDTPDVYARTRLHLVEASPRARETQHATLGSFARRLASSSATMPASMCGVVMANELLDAMPVHQVVMRSDSLREVYVDVAHGRLVAVEGPLSTARLSAHFDALGVRLEEGWRAEVGLAALDWMHDTARTLTRGFVILIDYGHEAHELYSVSHSGGTLATYSRHTSDRPGAAASAAPSWLERPGEQDLTAHVDFTSIVRAAESHGCIRLGLLDQTYFLMALATTRVATFSVKERLAFKMLVLPGGLGSTMKVLVLAKDMGMPVVTGCPARARLT
jgi:SAM-dependent MidA family methyltransferase